MENYIENPDSLIFKDAKGIDTAKPNMLFSSLWHQDEVAVFFGNQQSGKSLLAVQIADAISTGKAMEGFKLESAPQKVLYFDFDKSSYCFNRLYASYQFNPNFRRLVVNKKNLDFKHLAEQLFFSVEELVCEEGASVLIFDSLPAIKCFVKDSYFLKGIQRLKEFCDLSILLMGETKKEIKDKPLRLNHLDAHKQLVGFADSVFAMGSTSGGADERYLIHLKSNESRVHHKDNVITGKIQFPSTVLGSARTDSRAVTGVTPVTPFLPGFVFSGYNTESCVIAPPPEGLDLDILMLCYQQPGLSMGQVAKELKTNKMRVKRVLERYSSSPLTHPATPAKIPDPAGNGGTPSEHGLIRLGDGAEGKPSAKSQQALDTVVTSTLKNDKITGATSFSNPRLQPGGLNEDDPSSPCPLLSPATSPQGGMPNAEPDTNNTPVALNADPFRGEVVPSNHPSDPGVKPQNAQLTFTQRVKNQIAQKNKKRVKSR